MDTSWFGNMSTDPEWLLDGPMLLRANEVAPAIRKRLRKRSVYDRRRIGKEAIRKGVRRRACLEAAVLAEKPVRWKDRYVGLETGLLQIGRYWLDAERVALMVEALGGNSRLRWKTGDSPSAWSWTGGEARVYRGGRLVGMLAGYSVRHMRRLE